MQNLAGWILQMDNYFPIMQTWNEVQQLAYIGLYIEGDALEYWKSNRQMFNACKEVKDTTREDYGNHYKLNRALYEISDLQKRGCLQKDLNDKNRLNLCAKMRNHHLVNIILNGSTPWLCQAVANCEDVCCDLPK